MADQRCPNCGAELPEELGQHALTPSAGVVTCPSCGATVTLEKPGAKPESKEEPEGEAPAARAAPPGRTEGTETFAGEETVAGVMEEVRAKEGEEA